MSYEESPWEREDKEILEAFAAKDAEIARLKQLNLMTDDEVVLELKAEIERLKGLVIERDNWVKPQEIERLSKELETEKRHCIEDDRDLNELLERNEELKSLVTKLADALACVLHRPEDLELIQRAREAVR
jgi:predicted RNase H-like nuclease (RuvC/YqgF family)